MQQRGITNVWRFFLFRIEASQCPDVVVAQIDPKKLRKKQTVNISVSL